MLPLPVERGETLTEPTLLWCSRGRARVEVDGVVHRITAGRALWVPRGSRLHAALSSDDVVVPVPGLTCGRASSPTRIEVPESWELPLLHAFGEALAYQDGVSTRTRLSEMLAAVTAEHRAVARPPAPLSVEMTALAAAIEGAPSVPIAELVRRGLPGWTQRTLERKFRQETGVAPARWARNLRMALAADLLASGEEVDTVAQRVGYLTSSGFSRQFREITGTSPGRWRQPISANEQDALRPGPMAPDEALPAHRTWLRANGAHVAVWVACGSATITVASRDIVLSQGEAIIIPAGVPNSIRLSRGTLLLPVGYRSGRLETIGALSGPASIRAEEAPEIIQAMVAAYTGVRPVGRDPGSGFDLVRARSTPSPVVDDDVLLARMASAVATGDIPEPTLADCALWSRISERDLTRIVNERAGMTFAQWVRVSRMSRARVQLHGGATVSTVSRELGYAHLPAFSRAFREVHGTSPRTMPVVSQSRSLGQGQSQRRTA